MGRVVLLMTAASIVVVASRERTVWDGVYNDAQAKRGAKIYTDACGRCHGEALQGDGTASALIGPGFLSDFDGVTLGEIVDRTRKTMPEDDPGTMSRQQIADVMTYVLSVNKFPAGEAELPAQADVLSQIKFVATRPKGNGGRADQPALRNVARTDLLVRAMERLP